MNPTTISRGGSASCSRSSFLRIAILAAICGTLSTVEVSAETLQEANAWKLLDLGEQVEIRQISEEAVNGGVLIVGAKDEKAAMWDLTGTMTDLHARLSQDPDNPNVRSFALGVGTGVVGYKVTKKRGETGFWFHDGTMDDWATRKDHQAHSCYSQAVRVNYQSEVLMFGQIRSPDGARYQSGEFLWESDKLTPLPKPKGSSIVPKDLLTDLTGNHLHFIADVDHDQILRGDARNGTYEVIGTRAEAIAINNLQQVIGISDGHEILWNKGEKPLDIHNAPAKNGTFYGLADLNGLGEAIGGRDFWVLGKPGQYTVAQMRRVDIADIIEPAGDWSRDQWGLSCINDAGFIAGTRENRKTGVPHGIVLIPRARPANVSPGPATINARFVDPFIVQLTWESVGDGVRWLEIERKEEGGEFKFLRACPPGKGFEDRTASVQSVKSYSYRVRANNVVGYSGCSEAATVTRGAKGAPGGTDSGK